MRAPPGDNNERRLVGTFAVDAGKTSRWLNLVTRRQWSGKKNRTFVNMLFMEQNSGYWEKVPT